MSEISLVSQSGWSGALQLNAIIGHIYPVLSSQDKGKNILNFQRNNLIKKTQPVISHSHVNHPLENQEAK